jgi:multidrug resistance protein MdtO
VLTCIVTALTTVGFSLQAQFLRLAGFVAGGVLMGISAQVLILPGIDTAFGFALFFAAGTALSAWFATSSPRLSYFGVQMALSFYFVNLQDAHIQTDLTIARDKVAGVFLGILAMGFVFDRFGTKSDAEQLQKLLVRTVRMLAQLMTSPMGHEAAAVIQNRRLRNQINDSFATLESQIDAARFEFEFHGRGQAAVAECSRIQRVLPWLRSIYLLKLALNSHRVRREIDFEFTHEQNEALEHFLSESGDKLMHIAAWLAREEGPPAPYGDDSARLVRKAFEGNPSPKAQVVDDICQKMGASFVTLTNEC